MIVAHNFYKQAGGEDEVFASEISLLQSRGHEVHKFIMRNDDIELMGKLAMFGTTLWNGDAKRKLANLVRETRAELVHFHNTFPLMSPAVYYAARDAGAAVVQTLHNYRLSCPASTFYRDGKLCEDCLGKIPWRAVKHNCYRGRGTSAVSATMLGVHRAMGTYRNAVDAYVALSEFAKNKFIEGGLPADKMYVKANFVNPDPGAGTGDGGYMIFVGRLTEEKGILTLLSAWRELNGACQLKIVGDGPLKLEVEKAAQEIPGIEYLGRRPLSEVCDLIGRAGALVFPSVWYEGMPRTIVESFAKGTPVIASKLGTMAEMIEDGVSGWLFTPGNASELAAAVKRAVNEPAIANIRGAARREFETNYTAGRNYDCLMHIYAKAMERRDARVSSRDEDCDVVDAGATHP
ncbi:MAG TPA: glycosyltransferase [Tepidisphaeraceae bacterium]|nr:glycosyltransferase [Tepidisphaeraceae bacterium]